MDTSSAAPRTPALRARVVLLRGEGPRREVLLVHHRHPNRAAFWCFPGGRVEAGEGVAAAAIREMREETGLHVTLQGVCFVQDRPEADALDVYFSAVYGTVPGDGAEATLGSDPDRPGDAAPVLGDVRWFPLSALPGVACLPGELAEALTAGRFEGWGRLPLPD